MQTPRPKSAPAQPMNTSPQSSVSRLSSVRPRSMPPSKLNAPAGGGGGGDGGRGGGMAQARGGRRLLVHAARCRQPCTFSSFKKNQVVHPAASYQLASNCLRPGAPAPLARPTRQPRLLVNREQALQRRQRLRRRQLQQRKRGAHADACGAAAGGRLSDCVRNSMAATAKLACVGAGHSPDIMP